MDIYKYIKGYIPTTINGISPIIGDYFVYTSKYGEVVGIVKEIDYRYIISTNGVRYEVEEIVIDRARKRDESIGNILSEI